jgi:Uma2 family endonuclease
MTTKIRGRSKRLPPFYSETGDWEWYPSHGDPPLTDTELQRIEREELYWVLAHHFRGPGAPYVGADMFVYYERGNRDKKVSPDLFVCFGVSRRIRRVYKTWEEEHGLDWVLEIVSKGTWSADLNKKRRLYAERMGLQEYFVYDPEGAYLDEPLLGFHRVGEALEPIGPIARGHYRSALLDLDLRVRPFEQEIGRWRMDLYRPGGIPLLRSDEALELERSERAREAAARKQEAAARKREVAARKREAAARKAAEAEVRRLQKELQRLRPPEPPASS